MIKIIRSVLSILVAATAILFAIANRDPVAVTLSPVHDAFEIPVFLVGLSGVLFGFLIGGAMVWLNDSVLRTERRRQRKAIRALEKKLENNDATLTEVPDSALEHQKQ